MDLFGGIAINYATTLLHPFLSSATFSTHSSPPPAQMALAVSCGNNMQFLNPTDGTVHASVTPCAARSLAVRKEWVYASQRKEAAITIWRMGQKSPHVKCRLGEIMGALIVSPDGAYIFAGGASGSLYVWESWSGSVRVFTGGPSVVSLLAFFF